MLVRFNIADTYSDPFIAVNAQEKTPDLETLAHSIEQIVNDRHIQGYKAGRRKVIPLYQIISLHTNGKDVVCDTATGTYKVHKRIYELKQLLPEQLFIQISSSEIVNVASIRDFSLTKTGSYKVNLTNNTATYTSRRYMQRLRKGFLK